MEPSDSLLEAESIRWLVVFANGIVEFYWHTLALIRW